MGHFLTAWFNKMLIVSCLCPTKYLSMVFAKILRITEPRCCLTEFCVYREACCCAWSEQQLCRGRNADDGINWWTNGFWGGTMWLMYQDTKEEKYTQTARISEEKPKQCFQEYYELHYDVGFLWASLRCRLYGYACGSGRLPPYWEGSVQKDGDACRKSARRAL